MAGLQGWPQATFIPREPFPGFFLPVTRPANCRYSPFQRQDRRLIISPACIAMGSAAMRKEGGFPPECLSHP